QYALRWRLQDLKQGPCYEEAVVIDVDLAFARLPDRQQLALVVPLVESMRGVDALVALQPHQFAVEHGCKHLGGLGLADAWRALQKQWLAEPQGEEHGSRQTIVSNVLRLPEPLGQSLGRGGDGRVGQGGPSGHAARCALSARNMRSGVIGR